MRERGSETAQPPVRPWAEGEWICERLGYEKVEPIGQGGFGRVFRACRGDGHAVALKVSHESGPQVQALAEREFARLERVRHPAIVRYLALRSVDNTPVFELELIERSTERLPGAATPGWTAPPPGAGASDERVVWRSRRAVEVHRAWIRQAFDGLCALHRAGVLHGDIKPSNLLRATGGRVVWIDFGLSASTASAPVADTPGGTPQYAAPEIIETGRTVATDLYAFGRLVRRIVAGRREAELRLAQPGPATDAWLRPLMQLCAPWPLDRLIAAAQLVECFALQPIADQAAFEHRLPREPVVAL